MKIIFMGTPDFAVVPLDKIYNAGHEIVLIVTQPDKARGRSGRFTPSPVKEWALEHGIEVFQPERIRDEEAVEFLSKIECDIAVVAAFGQILPKAILDMPGYGCINIHASLLPKYRGAAPIQWAILNGEKKSGVTIMQMGEGLDDGDMLLTREVTLDGTETGGSLFDELAILGGEAVTEALELIKQGSITPLKQDESLATHVSMISKDLGLIDWTKPAEVIERYVRGLNPWPSAYSSLKGKTLKIWRSHVVPAEELDGKDIILSDYKSGQVCFLGKKCVYIATGDGVLSLDEIQLEGKKRMEIAAFLLGNDILPGEELGIDGL